MKKYLLLLPLLLLSSCSKVPAGYVGVKVHLLGGAKGVDAEVLPVGRYMLGINEELYLFPTFQQNYTWTRDPIDGDNVDESLTFQSKEGMSINADVGITYHIDSSKVATIFQKYRKGVNEITDVVLRNIVRDKLVEHASAMSVETINGNGKVKLMDEVLKSVAATVASEGIVVENLYLVGSPRLPESVVKALNASIEATQRSIQRQNEVAEAIAAANKAREEARGIADANRIKAASLSPQLIEWEKVKSWDGKLPQVTGSGTMNLIDFKK